MKQHRPWQPAAQDGWSTGQSRLRLRFALAGVGDDGSDEMSAAAASFEYVPGAGDDEESWARGLTPQVQTFR